MDVSGEEVMGKRDWGDWWRVFGEECLWGCVKESGEKRWVEVGGDPVGSTDPEWILWGPHILRCSRIYIPAPIRHVKMPLYPTLGVQRQVGGHFGRSTPICVPFLALNARTMPVLAFSAQKLPILGVQRQNHALFWRWTPDRCSSRVWFFFCCFWFRFQLLYLFCDSTWSWT